MGVLTMLYLRGTFLVSCLLSPAFGSSSKKGLCIPPGDNFHCGDIAAFTNVSWWYNWHVTPNHELVPPEEYCACSDPCGPPPKDKTFIPMVWGYLEDDRPWHDDINDPVADEYSVILGFNEPNHADQADIPPEVAASAWMELQNLYPDRTLVSPSAAGGGNLQWFDAFFQACEVLGCRIDYLATHDYHGDVDLVMDRLEMLHQRFGLKIWLTEFAKCCTKDETEVSDFMKEIIPRLEAADFVYRYSWFITRYTEKNFTGDWYLDSVNSLFEKDSPELSKIGQLYNSL